MNEHREKLEDIIRQGVAVDLFHADEALSLDMFVGQHANEINKATFGAFFGSLQIMLIRRAALVGLKSTTHRPRFRGIQLV